MMLRLVCCLALAALGASPAIAQEPKDKAKEEAALIKKAETFLEAFQKGDAKALAACWTSDGDYTTPAGQHLKGRDTIQKAFEEFFADKKDLKLKIDSHSLRFVTPEVAIEDGVTEVIYPDGTPPTRARYTTVHVKKDGEWLISSVRDAPYTPPGNYDNLKVLDWAVGDWVAVNDKGEAEHLSLAWTDNQNFLIGSFSATVKGISVGHATHWIGWDPQTRRVRSWIFDATGGFGEGEWSQDGNKWTLKTTSVLQDGKKASATIVLARLDDDTLGLALLNRTVEGKPVAGAAREFKLKRVKE